MKSARVLVFLAALLCACGTAAQAGVGDPAPVGEKVAPAPKLVAIDMFGTRQISLQQLLAAKGAALRATPKASSERIRA